VTNAATQNHVLVGVDDSPAAVSAARYAVSQAERRGLDLVVAHAYSVPTLQEPLSDSFFTEVRDAAQDVVDRILALLEIPPTVVVRTKLQQTSAALLLGQAATTARLVVLGQPAGGWLEHLVGGRVAHPLLKTATCPVVVVPTGWRPAERPSQPVVVALEGGSRAAAALVIAFEEAELRGTGVLALHATDAHSYPRDVANQERNTAEILAGSKQDYPLVPVSVLVVSGDPAHALIESSTDACLLVVSTSQAFGLGAWTRSVARSVLRRSACPVAIVPSGADLFLRTERDQAAVGIR
jgi:nucleotide-binding universal stress UspA family protein